MAQQNNPAPPGCMVNGTECYDGWVWVIYLFIYLFIYLSVDSTIGKIFRPSCVCVYMCVCVCVSILCVRGVQSCLGHRQMLSSVVIAMVTMEVCMSMCCLSTRSYCLCCMWLELNEENGRSGDCAYSDGDCCLLYTFDNRKELTVDLISPFGYRRWIVMAHFVLVPNVGR